MYNMAVGAICRTAPDCRTKHIIYSEGGVHVHAFPLLGRNNQCVIASNQNSMAERSLFLCSMFGARFWMEWVLRQVRIQKWAYHHQALQVCWRQRQPARSFKGFCTARSTKWVLKNLQAWKDAITQFPNYLVPENLLKSTDESVLCLYCPLCHQNEEHY